MRKEAWGQAIGVLEKIGSHGLPPGQLTSRVNALLAECFERVGNADQQLNAWRRAIESDPKWLFARRGKAAALVAVGKFKEAIKEYRALTLQVPELGIEFARVLLAWNLRVPAAQQDWSEVEKIFTGLPEGQRQTTDSQLLWANVLAARQQLDEARKVAAAARDRDPKQVGPWLLLAGLLESQGQAQLIVPLLDEAERQVGKRPEWELARVEYWLKKDPQEARKQLPKMEAAAEQFPEAERNRLLLGLADAYAPAGDLAAADRLWTQLAQRQPNNLMVRRRLLERAFQTGQEVQLQGLVEQIKSIEGENGALAAYGEAAYKVLLARRGNKKALAEAYVHVAKVEGLRPSWSRPPLLAAEVYELENRKEKAVEKYLAAFERGENRLVFYQKALRLLYEQGRYAEATALLRKLPQQALAVRDLGRMAAQLALMNPDGEDGEEPAQKRQRALELARRTVAEHSKDHRDYLWLGQISALAGRQDDAEKAFLRARDLSPTVPETWAALIGFLARTDRTKAEAEMAQASRALGKDQLGQVLAPCYEALGRLDQAEENYRAAVAAKRDDATCLRELAAFYARTGQAAKAVPVLREIINSKTAAADQTVAWARRYLAMTLAIGGRVEAFREALALLEENQKEKESTVEDVRAKAMVLATQPDRRREAITLFESSDPYSSSMPHEARFVLAQLYETEGNWPKARAHMLALLNDHAKNPIYLARYIRGLLRQGEADIADVWVERLAKVAPQTFQTIELQVRWLLAKGQTDEAANLLTSYAREKNARLDGVALLLDQCGKTAEAEQTYRAHAAASRQPESILLLAQFLARHDRLAEALQICEQAWQTCHSEAVAAVSVWVVCTAHGSEPDQQRVERWLTTSIAKNPMARMIPVTLATLHEFRGHYDEAIALYRKTLQQDKNNVQALNNLAYLLAWKEGKNGEARELIQTAINLAGPNPQLLDTRGVVSLMNDQLDLAIRDLQAVVMESPSAAGYFHLALAHQLAKNRSVAVKSFRKATDLGLKTADLHPLEQPAWQQLADELEVKRN
jgi:tetratricopeptide (TPR) repeat protein